MNKVLKALKYFFVWRILLFLPIILGTFLNHGNYYPLAEITYSQNLPNYLTFPVLTAWSNFDGVHYLNIAIQGYISEARFFPLFPIIILLLSFGSVSLPLTFIVALIIPNIFFPAALIMFYKLLKLDYSKEISIRAIFYLLIFPTAFFFISVYTESLFLLLLVLSFYFARRRKWLGAIICGLFLILTRFVGIFIIPALIYEYLIQNISFKFKNYLQLGAIILITPLGLAAYSIFNYQKWGNFFYFLTAHSQLNNGRSSTNLIFPLQTVYRYFKILTSIPLRQFEWWIALLEVMAFFFGLTIFILAWKKKVRLSYLIFGSLAFLLPSFSGTFSGLPRYLLIIFPVFIILAQIKSRSVKIFYSIISTIFLFILLMFFSRSYYIA